MLPAHRKIGPDRGFFGSVDAGLAVGIPLSLWTAVLVPAWLIVLGDLWIYWLTLPDFSALALNHTTFFIAAPQRDWILATRDRQSAACASRHQINLGPVAGCDDGNCPRLALNRPCFCGLKRQR